MGLRSRFGEIKRRFRQVSVEERTEVVTFRSCARRVLVVGMFGHRAIVTLKFEEDILWHQKTSTGNNTTPGQLQQTEGVAAIKLSLVVDEEHNNNLDQVRCRMEFSQEIYHGFHVHECWPCIRGQQNARIIGKGGTFSPVLEFAGGSGSLGSVHLETEETRLSAWTFMAKSSPSSCGLGVWEDVVTFSWTAPEKSDHTNWSGRTMYGAAALVCVDHDLTIEPSIHKALVGLHPQAKADIHLEKKHSLRGKFGMTRGEPGDLGTLSANTETWTTDRNRQAVPPGMCMSIEYVHVNQANVYIEMA